MYNLLYIVYQKVFCTTLILISSVFLCLPVASFCDKQSSVFMSYTLYFSIMSQHFYIISKSGRLCFPAILILSSFLLRNERFSSKHIYNSVADTQHPQLRTLYTINWLVVTAFNFTSILWSHGCLNCASPVDNANSIPYYFPKFHLKNTFFKCF